MTDNYKICIELMTCSISQAQMEEKQKKRSNSDYVQEEVLITLRQGIQP